MHLVYIVVILTLPSCGNVPDFIFQIRQWNSEKLSDTLKITQVIGALAQVQSHLYGLYHT